MTIGRGAIGWGMDDKSRVLEHAIAFLRMAAIQLRNMAECAPDIADQLRHTADGLDSEAAELSGHFGISLPASGD